MSLIVRPAAETELAQLQANLPTDKARRVVERFERQQAGDMVYLVAWDDGRPVGHTLIHRRAPEYTPIVKYLPDHPVLEDLYVSPERRGQGIGSRLVQAAEDLVRAWGNAAICLGVAIDNPRAHQLYQRLGYQDAGIGVLADSWDGVDDQGRPQTFTEDFVTLVKQLG